MTKPVSAKGIVVRSRRLPNSERRYGLRNRKTSNDSSLGRRLKVGHRLLEPGMGVRFLPPQIRAQDTGNRAQGDQRDKVTRRLRE